MAGNTIIETLEHIRSRDGEDGYMLAKTIVGAFVGVGRGISGKQVVKRLADEVEKGTIHMRGRTFIYDRNNSTRTLGAEGDEVLSDIVRIAMTVHGNAKKKQVMVDPYYIYEGIVAASRNVSWEINWRDRNRKIRSWFRSLLPFK